MIGKALETIITGDTAIQALIAGKLFPISDYAQGTPAIYYIVRCIPHSNKNGQQMQDWQVTFVTVNNTYKGAWKLAFLIKEAMEAKLRNTTDGIKFSKAECKIITDDYEFQNATYGHKIEFDIKTQTLKASDIK